MFVVIVAASILSLSGQEALQAPQAVQPSHSGATRLPPVNATGSRPEEARSCRYEQAVGSNRRQRVCVSASERDQQRADARALRDRVGSDINAPQNSGFGGDSARPQ